MFTPNSRYHGLSTVTVVDGDGEERVAVKLRALGTPASRPATVVQGDQLDVIAERRYRDATRYWHVADANTELEANALVQVPNRVIRTPER